MKFLFSLPFLFFALNLDARGNDRYQRVAGTYKVTLNSEDASLEPMNSFPVEYKIRRRNGAIEKISYDLPSQLTGLVNEVEFSPIAQGSDVWAGPNSENVCTVSDVNINCAMKYKDIQLDPIVAQNVIDQQIADPVANEAARRIMSHFQQHAMGNEPIGHVEISLEEVR